uniref:NADH-ubiquinone oxidoreductase chain 6 n=1 Tax=Trigonopterus carinirostris TaxID=2576104 RepID=A0A7H1KI15_9CUCU|nr:NADH dehydrogenase subunit 6 [Trigonopterus carinirostris]QNT26931.1 NADH dehydrogenase subunit 6 [Trigonopterus carinirostris]
MIYFTLMMNWTFSMLFLGMNHPLSMGSILLIQTILVALYSGLIFLNFWFSYILFLVMIGGMLVMFMYMTSIASNEKFNLPKHSMYYSFISLMVTILMTLFLDNYTFIQFFSSISSIQQTFHLSNLSMMKYFNFPGLYFMISLMIYLLITLIAIVKMIDKTQGTLRQK